MAHNPLVLPRRFSTPFRYVDATFRRLSTMSANGVLMSRVRDLFAEIRGYSLAPHSTCGWCRRSLSPIEVLYGLNHWVELGQFAPATHGLVDFFDQVRDLTVMQAVCPHCGRSNQARVDLLDQDQQVFRSAQLVNVSALSSWYQARLQQWRVAGERYLELEQPMFQNNRWLLLNTGYRYAMKREKAGDLIPEVQAGLDEHLDIILNWWFYYGSIWPWCWAAEHDAYDLSAVNAEQTKIALSFGLSMLQVSDEINQALHWGGRLPDRVIAQCLERDPSYISWWRQVVSRDPDDEDGYIAQPRPPFDRRSLYADLEGEM